MKLYRILLLFLITITLSGCSTNYQSLNDMAIVSSVLIDKDEDNNFITYIELYKEEKSENKSKKVSYFVKGLGKSIKSSMNNAASSISKNLYYVHINAVIFSKDVASTNMEDLFNYLVSRVQINSNYYILISDDIKELLDTKDNDNDILGEKIDKLINNSSNSGTMANYDFMEILRNFTSPNKDIHLNKISERNDITTIKDGYYFNGEKLAGELDNNDLKLINLFKKSNNIYFTYKYNKDYYNLKIDSSNVSYNIKDKINIKLDIKADIDTAGENIKTANINVVEKLNKHTAQSIEHDLNNLLNRLKKDKSDILGINNYIYKIYGKKKLDFFKDDFDIKVNVVINKKGLVHDTLGGNYHEKE